MTMRSHVTYRRDARRNAEVRRTGADGDEFGDEREQVADREVGHCEAAPTRAETIDDQFGVAATRRDSDAHDHLLHDVCQNERQDDEREEEADAERCAGHRVGQHAGAVVLAEHHEDTGPGEKRE
jgi:hypothetical protein